ncbi:MAG TPA: hypothetical protein VGX48_02720 [Pyrinomonadaceae bacterium]|jgi:hypothetical protein|nr:hypothetical protein [Pyrinomonadaceae bacterium]
MDELIRQVTERTGISEQQARTAVETVIGFLKTRLPAPIAGHLDSFTGGGATGSGGGGLADQAGDVLGGLGGMFGGGGKQG